MQVKHTINIPSFNEVKTKVINSRWTPVAVIVASTFVAVRLGGKSTQITINNYTSKTDS